MLKKHILILIALLMFLSIESLHSDCIRGSYFIRNYTPEEYGSFPQTWATLQDNNGVMYFGNSAGIIEYDGLNWRIIKTKTEATIRSLALDSKGVIYVGAIGDFGYLYIDKTGKKQFKSLKYLLKGKDININNIHEVYSISDGVYFIEEEKVLRYYKNEIEVIPLSAKSKGAVINDLIYIQGEDGIYVIYSGKKFFLPFTQELKPEIAGRVLILPYDSGQILFLTEKKGGFLYDVSFINKKNIKILSKHKGLNKDKIIKVFKTELKEYAKKYRLYIARVLDNNLYAIAPFEGGIILMNKNGKIVHIINEKDGLQNNIVFDIYVDKDKNIWANLNSGISFIETGSPITFFGKIKGLNNMVLTIIKHNNKIYVASMDGNHYLPNCNDYDFFANKGFKRVEGSNYSVFSMLNYKNMLLMGGYGGLFYLKENKVYKLKDYNIIYTLEILKKNPDKILVGRRGGLSIVSLKKRKNEIKVSEYEIKEIKGIVRRTTIDKNGDIWVTTQNKGLVYIKFKTNKIDDYKIYRITSELGLPEPENYFAYLINKEIVIVTPDGFFKAIIPQKSEFNINDIKFVPFYSMDNLIGDSNNVSIIKQSKTGEIFVGMSNGLGILKKDKKGKTVFIKKTFAKIKEYVTDILFDQDNIWVGTTKGLYKFNKKIKKNYDSSFNTLIRKIVINNKNTIYYNDYHVKSNNKIGLSFLQKEQLPEFYYNQNSLYFEFTATFYEHEKENRYKYKLEGYDKKWSKWVAYHKKEYTNLSPGYYVFIVKAKNIFGVVSKEARFAFRILPPWYMTGFAYVAYIIVFGLFLYLILWINSLRHKKAKEKLEEIIKERTKTIEKQKRELEIINKKLKQLATIDGLTGLYNKRKFEELYDYEWKRAIRNKSSLGIIMIDIDFFKLYNDTYGHQAGDMCLKKVAEAIHYAVNRPADAVARYGGEEFIVLLPETDKKGVRAVAEKIRKKVENLKLIHEKSKIHKFVTISVGCSSIVPDSKISPLILIKIADDALYESKEKGRNRVTYIEIK